MKYCVDYEKIYEAIRNNSGKVITAAKIAYATGIDRIHGATMSKLVREGILEPANAKGYYWIVGR